MNQEIWAQGLIVPAWSAATALALYRFIFRDPVAGAGAALAVLATAFWIIRTRPRRIPLSQAAALTDKRVGAGGLLLTRLEVAVGEWELSLNERVRAVTPPDISLRRPLGQVALALLFLAVALSVPLPPASARPVNAAAATKLAQVETQAEALSQERPLPEEAAELARLRDELATGRFDATDWEAADGLSQTLSEKAAQRSAELAKAEAAAKSLEDALARGASRETESREQDALERALTALGEGSTPSTESPEKPGQDGSPEPGPDAGPGDRQGSRPGDGQGPQPAEASQGDGPGRPSNSQATQGQHPQGTGARSPSRPRSRSEVSELRRALASRQRALEKSFGQGTGKAPRDTRTTEGNSDGDGEPRLPHPSQATQQGHPGVGTDRGGEHRPLVFGGDARMDDPQRLEFSPLPKGQGGEAGDLWGLRGADPRPDVEHARGTATGASASGERAPSTRAEPLLPRNRELVRRYFDSK